MHILLASAFHKGDTDLKLPRGFLRFMVTFRGTGTSHLGDLGLLASPFPQGMPGRACGALHSSNFHVRLCPPSSSPTKHTPSSASLISFFLFFSNSVNWRPYTRCYPTKQSTYDPSSNLKWLTVFLMILVNKGELKMQRGN